MMRSSQLNYRPSVVGAPRIELGTSVLSGLRSSHLSYAPISLDPICKEQLLKKQKVVGNRVLL